METLATKATRHNKVDSRTLFSHPVLSFSFVMCIGVKVIHRYVNNRVLFFSLWEFFNPLMGFLQSIIIRRKLMEEECGKNY